MFTIENAYFTSVNRDMPPLPPKEEGLTQHYPKKVVWVNIFSDGSGAWYPTEEQADSAAYYEVTRMGGKAYKIWVDV